MRAVVMGGTGMVGLALLRQLAHARVPTVSLARRMDAGAPGVEWRILESTDLGPADIPPRTTVGFCALGTTMRKAGSKAAFRAVDHDLVLRFARACREAGVPSFHVVSASGANPRSPIFYSRIKGETERDLAALDFATLGLHRPSLLLGSRAERRPGERAAVAVARAIAPIVPTRWRAIPPQVVARAMLAEAKQARPGVRILENRDLFAVGR